MRFELSVLRGCGPEPACRGCRLMFNCCVLVKRSAEFRERRELCSKYLRCKNQTESGGAEVSGADGFGPGCQAKPPGLRLGSGVPQGCDPRRDPLLSSVTMAGSRFPLRNQRTAQSNPRIADDGSQNLLYVLLRGWEQQRHFSGGRTNPRDHLLHIVQRRSGLWTPLFSSL